jgi:hypothetical protein
MLDDPTRIPQRPNRPGLARTGWRRDHVPSSVDQQRCALRRMLVVQQAHRADQDGMPRRAPNYDRKLAVMIALNDGIKRY